MKKVRILGIGLVFCLALSMLALLPFNTVSASAAVNALDTMNIENVTQALFGDKQINKTEYLYNLNDSPDFVYVEFSDYGYAVYLRETAELLEYAPSGRLPFSSNKTRNYYGGPTNYFGKYSDQFIDLSTDEIFYVSNAEKQRFSQELLNIFSESSVDRANRLDITNADENGYSITNNEPIGKSPTGSDKPSLDDEGIIITPLPGSTGTHYISNAQYFLSNPRHGNNSTDTCGAVAAQLMLSYHNYYSDRRIIAEGHLNGNWNGTTNTFLTTNNLEQSPNTCTDPRTMNRNTLGSNGYNENTANTFFNVMVNAIPANATTSQVRNGMRNVLNNRNVSYSVDSHEPFLWIGPIGESGIKSEINANRPTILLLQRSLGGWNHYVVAYGYMDMVSPTNGSTYSGYITHFGHSDNSPSRLNVWVNSAWTYSYISMTVNHTHTYTSTGTVLNGSEMIRQCACGHRDVDTLFNLSGGTITGLKYSLTSSTALTIPSVINGTTITAIGASAFANQTQLSQISIPASVITVGSFAFSGCTALTSVAIPAATCIFVNAFYGCANLPGNWNYRPTADGIMIEGDYNGDGIDDIAMFLQNGNNAELHVWTSTGASFEYDGLWNVFNDYSIEKIRGRVVSGNYDGQGGDDIAVFYDNANSVQYITSIYVYLSSEHQFIPQEWHRFVNYEANRITDRVVSGNFKGYGPDDIAVFYDHSNNVQQNVTSIYIFLSLSDRFRYVECHTFNNYDANRITGRVTAGDFNGDGRCDIAVFYDHSNNVQQNVTSIYVYLSVGESFGAQEWHSVDRYEANRITGRVVSGRFKGYGADDIAVLYDHNTYSSVYAYLSTGSTFVFQAW